MMIPVEVDPAAAPWQQVGRRVYAGGVLVGTYLTRWKARRVAADHNKALV